MGGNISKPINSINNSNSLINADFLGELGGEVQYEKSMGTSRFLKTIRAKHKEGPLIIKVFIKPDPSLSLKLIHRRLKAEREALIDCPNVLSYQRIIETERAGYLIRQWIASNLYDRISTRPFLSLIEKRWIAFQLLTGLKHARARGIAHGDIKTENVLVTSWNWVYLSDFATFKPTYLPLDDPSTFSYYFDTSSRRTCYLAPERFYPANSDMARKKEKLEFGKRDGKVTEAMDVFSLGCVLAELWMEGTAPFTLSQMFKYREGEYKPDTYLAEIEDVEIRTLIRSMISLDPSARLTCEEYLTTYRDVAFPEIFYTFLHPFISSLNETSNSSSNSAPSTSYTARESNAPTTATSGMNLDPLNLNNGLNGGVELRSDADDRIERIWSEWEMIEKYLDEGGVSVSQKLGEDRRAEAAETSRAGRGDPVFPMRFSIPGLEGQFVSGGNPQDGPALVVLSLICSNLRNCARPSSVLRALDLLLALTRFLSDETKLDRLLPHLVSMLKDESASVRSFALKSLTQILLLVTTITPSNASVFPEYILPNTRAFSSDPEVLAKMTYAHCIASLAKTSVRFLDMTEAMKTEGTFKLTHLHEFDGSPYEATYDVNLVELQSQIQDHLYPLLSDSSPVVKRALLANIGELCDFFGPIKSNDAILAHLITYLNTRDWRLRASWNENVVEVAECVGRRSLEEYILPLMVLGLADSEEFVTVTVLTSLTSLAEKHLLGKSKIWDIAQQIQGFLYHPNIWIRQGSATFLASVSKLMPPTDRWCILYPMIKRHLRADIKDITDTSILNNAREPVSRLIFDAAVSWAGKGKSIFWSPPSKGVAKGAPRDASIRTDEDHAQLQKLRQLGMKTEDEAKLITMREFISKLALSRQSASSRLLDSEPNPFMNPGLILQDLGVVPQTIFFSVKTIAETQFRNTSDNFPRRFSSDPPRSTTSVELGRTGLPGKSSHPVDDLRRRLAVAGVSNSTLPGIMSGDSSNTNSLHRRTSSQTSTDDLSDSIPATILSQPKVRSRVHGNGVDVGRVAPAIGQDSTNVMGMFNVEAMYRGEDDVMSAVTHAASQSGYGGKIGYSAPPRRFVSTYEGNDPNIKQLLERVYLDSYREPLPELGPRISVGIPRRKALRTSFPPRERTPSRPEGTLVAHLVEHKGAITDIKVSPDQLFFITGSEDGTIKVWDTIRLEKNVTSKSRQTFQQGGKITSICMLENSHCVASASDNGTLWIHRVDVSLAGSIPKYSKPQLIRQHTTDTLGDFITCIMSFNTDTTSNVLFGTALSSIVVLDIRTMRNLHSFTNPIQFGPITCLCVDRKRVWLVVGTAGGVLSLWDLRFGLLLRSWTVGSKRIHKVEVNPYGGKGRWIIVNVEDELVEEKSGSLVTEVWDIDRGVKVEEFRVVNGSTSTSSSSSSSKTNLANPAAMQEAILNPAAAIEALLNSANSSSSKLKNRTNSSDKPLVQVTTTNRRPGVLTFISGVDYSAQSDHRQAIGNSGELIETESTRNSGYLITAGEDRKLRFWDIEKTSLRSTVFSGLDLEEERPVFTLYPSSSRPSIYLESPPPARSRQSGSNVKVHRSTLIANSQQQILRGHQEAVTALALIDLPFRCIVSGDRSGVIKVFE